MLSEGIEVPCGKLAPSDFHHLCFSPLQLDLLPEEIVLDILSFLTPQELAVVAQTNSFLQALCSNNQLWKQVCRRDFSDEELEGNDVRGSTVKDWRQCYKNMLALDWQHQIAADDGTSYLSTSTTASIVKCGNTIFIGNKALSPKKKYYWRIQLKWHNEIWHRTVGVSSFKAAPKKIPPLSVWIGNQNTYWGKSWGFATKGATESLTYHNGQALRYSSLPPFRSGDIVGVCFDKGKLSFDVNGKEYGVAFSAIDSMVWPAVHLYDVGDSATIIEFKCCR